MTLSLRTYRHRETGLTQVMHPRVASADPHLIEVDDDAKPLAYKPIPQAAIDNLRLERAQGDTAGDAELDSTNDAAEDSDAQDEE